MSTALQLVESVRRPLGQDMQHRIGSLQLRSLEDFQTLGQVFVKSGFFADTKDAAQAIVKVMAGAELGFPAIASMTGVYIVKGKVSLSANLMASAIKRSGKYNYKVKRLDASACEIEFFEDGESIGVSTFTMAEAQAGKLHQDWDKEKREWKDKPTWKNFPRNMLFARAMSNGAKWFCPDIFGGPIYTPDELGATIDGETGEVIEVPAERIEATEPIETVTTIETVDIPTLAAIERLWPKYGVQIEGQSVSFREYLKQKKEIGDPGQMPQADAMAMLEFLQKRELAAKPKLAEESPAEEPKADQGSGLDQWLCTRESGSRKLAMDVLNATARLEATGAAEEQWRAELNDMFADHELPVSRRSLSADECAQWIELLNQWAKKREAKQ